jgi:hypothetical protein
MGSPGLLRKTAGPERTFPEHDRPNSAVRRLCSRHAGGAKGNEHRVGERALESQVNTGEVSRRRFVGVIAVRGMGIATPR